METLTETRISTAEVDSRRFTPLPLTGAFETTLVANPRRESETASRAPQAAREWGTDPRCTVLLVDDDADLRYIMGLTLSMMGFDVISCEGADRASAAFQSRDVDLLITDLEMPGRSGVELARELCALSSSLPVLIVSGAYLSNELTREMGERDWLFLAKPYLLPAFLANIQALVKHGAHRRGANPRASDSGFSNKNNAFEQKGTVLERNW